MSRTVVTALFALTLVGLATADEPAWAVLVGPKAGDVWKAEPKGWEKVASVKTDPKNVRRLAFEPNGDILVNGKSGRTRDLITKDSFTDVELELEFLIPKGSNSGVKFHAVYEIQICDSHGKKDKDLRGDDCGGVYPTADLLPVYKTRDKGVPPSTNACKPPGEWQKLTAVFLSPRFDAAGKKTANAKLVTVTLNGKVIHENVELKTPTGSNYKKKEVARGPILLQGDHGPVAFRNVRVRPFKPNEGR